LPHFGEIPLCFTRGEMRGIRPRMAPCSPRKSLLAPNRTRLGAIIFRFKGLDEKSLHLAN
jgi:hypothetical protein